MNYCLLILRTAESEQKIYKFIEEPVKLDHEKQIPYFKKYLEDQEIEIFEIKGHQLMTSNGLYLIASEDEIEPIKK